MYRLERYLMLYCCLELCITGTTVHVFFWEFVLIIGIMNKVKFALPIVSTYFIIEIVFQMSCSVDGLLP